MEAPKAPVALEALYVVEESYGARPVSGFADAPGRRDDIVAYADDSNLVTTSENRGARGPQEGCCKGAAKGGSQTRDGWSPDQGTSRAGYRA
jgi:hypothetical protein